MVGSEKEAKRALEVLFFPFGPKTRELKNATSTTRDTEKTNTPTTQHDHVTYANVMEKRSDFEFSGERTRSI